MCADNIVSGHRRGCSVGPLCTTHATVSKHPYNSFFLSVCASIRLVLPKDNHTRISNHTNFSFKRDVHKRGTFIFSFLSLPPLAVCWVRFYIFFCRPSKTITLLTLLIRFLSSFFFCLRQLIACVPYTSEPIDVLKVKKRSREQQQILQEVKSLSSPESGVCVSTEHFPSF